MAILKLTEQDFIEAAQYLNCEVAAIKAVTTVESKGSGFLSTGEPIILFERHIFHNRTKGKYSAQNPDISNPKSGGYGAVSIQHARLKKASTLDRNVALMSASWGLFQIMGFNFTLAGFNKLQDFINAMYKDEKSQLLAFCTYVRNVSLDDELRDKRWDDFARKYNGPDYMKNNYASKLHSAYIKFKG